MIRLAKYIADAGVCSRRAASRLIEAGEVEVNHRQAGHTDRVSDRDQVLVSGKIIEPFIEKVYFIYNKPIGIDCVCNPDDPASIIHHLPAGDNIPRLFPVGRLDKDSHGLMLLTNNGELCQRLMYPDFYHEKEYRVRVHREFDQKFSEQMSDGVCYNNIATRPCKIIPETPEIFRIVLTQGLNRQIRRMCQALGYRVVDLQRIRMINLALNDLPVGEYKQINWQG